MEEKEINPNESFAIINEMILTSKNKLADNGFLFVFWGWLVFIASLINYFSIILKSEYGFYVWPVLMPLGAIVSVLYGLKEKKEKKVKTYIDNYLSYSWLAFIIAMFITLIFIGTHGLKQTYFMLMLLYGIATLVSGGLLNFKPLVIGSFFSFFFAIIAVFLSDDSQYLCLAGALLCSYIIPGHLLTSKFKSEKNV